MGIMYEFSKLRNSYRIVFDRVLEGCSFYYGYDDEISFKDLYDREFKIYLDGKKIKIVKDFGNYTSIENIVFPGKYNDNIRSVETIVDENKVEVIHRFYNKPKDNNDNFYVVNLFSNTRYNNENINSNFECHMSENNSIVEVDNMDISYLYDEIKGSKRIEKIFDLYRGERTSLIRRELKDMDDGNLNKECFNYRENVIIKNKKIETVENSKVYKKV